ncbi:MAG: hypothetical protein IPG06_16860 [Haliea sp.]|nr:hypothetical protein [Haliea sp.]
MYCTLPSISKAISSIPAGLMFTGLKHHRAGQALLLILLVMLSNQLRAQGSLIEDGIVTGKIAVVWEKDEFFFNASAGEAVHIRVVETGGDTAFTPDFWLYNPDGTLEDYAYGSNTVAALDCYSSGSCRLEQTAPARILIPDDGNGYPGNYEIHFSRMPYANENGPLLNNGVVTDKIALGDIDSFTFKADAGDAAHIRIVETGGDTAFTPDFWLYNPDGTLEDYAYGSNTVAALDCYSSGSCRLEQTGTYRILIQDDGNGYPGNYEIHFSRMPYANENGPLLNNGVVTDKIALGDIDSFTFKADAGDAAHIRIVGRPAVIQRLHRISGCTTPMEPLEDYVRSNTVAALDCSIQVVVAGWSKRAPTGS